EDGHRHHGELSRSPLALSRPQGDGVLRQPTELVQVAGSDAQVLAEEDGGAAPAFTDAPSAEDGLRDPGRFLDARRAALMGGGSPAVGESCQPRLLRAHCSSPPTPGARGRRTAFVSTVGPHLARDVASGVHGLRGTTKVKIVRVIARLNVGGPAIHVINLNTGLDPAQFESILVTGTENPGEGTLLDLALGRGIRPIVIPQIVAEATLKPRDLKALIALYRLLRRERPNIVHTHTAKAGFVGRLAARLAGVPIVVHTYHGHVLHGYYSPRTTWLLRRMERMLGLLTSRIIAVSDQVKRDLVHYGVARAEKISVISLGFDLKPFLDSAVHRGNFRRELSLDNSTPLVGIVGRIFPIKNHRLFLDAAARIAAEEKATRFVIVGDGALRKQMEEHADRLAVANRVVFTGWRRDLPRIYADLDALVVSSNNEGTPVSAIEAMAAGCPVVATRVGGLPDLIDEGETGYLVPRENAHALAAAVLRLLRDREGRRRIGERARASVAERFTAGRLITDMEHFYTDLLAEKGIVTSCLLPNLATRS